MTLDRKLRGEWLNDARGVCLTWGLCLEYPPPHTRGITEHISTFLVEISGFVIPLTYPSAGSLCIVTCIKYTILSVTGANCTIFIPQIQGGNCRKSKMWKFQTNRTHGSRRLADTEVVGERESSGASKPRGTANSIWPSWFFMYRFTLTCV